MDDHGRDDIIEPHPSSQEDLPQYRENRFQGSDQQWNRYTKDERELNNHLDEQRANDLSIHLYNAHAIKALAYDKERDLKSWHPKQSWLSKGTGSTSWTVPQSWTSWPMAHDMVPRSEEGHGNLEKMQDLDQDVLKQPENWYPSLHLEDELLALLLRQAKVKLQGRSPQPQQQEHTEETAPSGVSEGGNSGSSSQHTSADHTVMLDEHDARRILLPDIRRILVQFDNMLSALHKSRAGHTVLERQGQTDVRKRKRDSIDAEFASPTGISREQELSAKGRSMLHGLHQPRDWSEVLGLSLMAGWDSDVVKAAAARCSRLFGEQMYLAEGDSSAAMHDLPNSTHRSVKPSSRKRITGAYLTAALDELDG